MTGENCLKCCYLFSERKEHREQPLLTRFRNLLCHMVSAAERARQSGSRVIRRSRSRKQGRIVHTKECCAPLLFLVVVRAQCRAHGMPLQAVEVCVPADVLPGQEFMIEYEGLQLSVECPDGCAPGDPITIEIDVPSDSQPQQVEIIIPDGCYPGMEFSVEHGGRSFNVAVPEGCQPGDALAVDVPNDDSSGPSTDCSHQAASEEPGGAGEWSCPACTYLNAATRRSCEMCGTPRELSDPNEADEYERSVQEQRDADLAKRLQSEEVRDSADTANIAGSGSAWCSSTAGASSSWSSSAGETPASGWSESQSQSLFTRSVGTDDGTFGNPAGDFYVGQLVQVTRSDGSWCVARAAQALHLTASTSAACVCARAAALCASWQPVTRRRLAVWLWWALERARGRVSCAQDLWEDYEL